MSPRLWDGHATSCWCEWRPGRGGRSARWATGSAGIDVEQATTLGFSRVAFTICSASRIIEVIPAKVIRTGQADHLLVGSSDYPDQATTAVTAKPRNADPSIRRIQFSSSDLTMLHLVYRSMTCGLFAIYTTGTSRPGCIFASMRTIGLQATRFPCWSSKAMIGAQRVPDSALVAALSTTTPNACRSRGGAGAAAETAQVGCDDPVSVLGEDRHDVPSGPPGLRPAVQQEHRCPRAADHRMQAHAVRGDDRVLEPPGPGSYGVLMMPGSGRRRWG